MLIAEAWAFFFWLLALELVPKDYVVLGFLWGRRGEAGWLGVF